jgi:hypothetical protein
MKDNDDLISAQLTCSNQLLRGRGFVLGNNRVAWRHLISGGACA